MSPSAKPYAAPVLVAERDWRELAPGSVVEEDRVRTRRVAEHDVGAAIVVQIAGRQRIRGLRLVGYAKPRREPSFPVVDIDDHRGGLFIAHSEIDRAVAVEICGSADTRGGVGGTEWCGSRKACLAIVEIDVALSAITTGHSQVDEAIFVEIGGHDGGG